MWTNDVSIKVFATVKTESSKILLSKYPDIFFTSSDKAQTSPKFPTVYIHEVGTTEQGMDLENTQINAGLFTFQIDVFDNQNQNRARDVMGEVMKVMKSMRFSVISMPEFQNTADTYRQTARFRRLIGYGEQF